MNVSNDAVTAKAGSANENLRPIAHAQFKLLPVPMRGEREWNDRVVGWARSA